MRKVTKNYHLDRRANQLLASAAADPAAANEDLLTTQRAADILGVSPQWLEVRRREKGAGPPWVRLGPRCIRYPYGDLIKWIKSRSARRV
jgi:predicted DNA-binding transcriptional regulator AlpA